MEPGNGPVEFLCRPPAERCANDSAKYDGFCVNGICCHNKLLGQEFCACYAEYSGPRCDLDALFVRPRDDPSGDAAPSENMAVIITVVVIVVLLVTAVVIFIVCRRRRSRMSRSGENGGVEHSVQFHSGRTENTPASDTAEKVLLSDNGREDSR